MKTAFDIICGDGISRPRLSWFTRFPPYYCPDVQALVLGEYFDIDADVRVVLLHHPEAGRHSYIVRNETIYVFEELCIDDLAPKSSVKAGLKNVTSGINALAEAHMKFAETVRCLSCGGSYPRSEDGSIPCGH